MITPSAAADRGSVSPAALTPEADIGSARRYISAGTFGGYWIAWVIVGGLLTFYLPLSFLLSNPAGAISKLSFMNLLDIFNRTGKIRPYAADAQSWAMIGLFGVVMLVTGPHYLVQRGRAMDARSGRCQHHGLLRRTP